MSSYKKYLRISLIVLLIILLQKAITHATCNTAVHQRQLACELALELPSEYFIKKYGENWWKEQLTPTMMGSVPEPIDDIDAIIGQEPEPIAGGGGGGGMAWPNAPLLGCARITSSLTLASMFVGVCIAKGLKVAWESISEEDIKFLYSILHNINKKLDYFIGECKNKNLGSREDIERLEDNGPSMQDQSAFLLP